MTYAMPPDIAAMIDAHVSSGRYESEDEVLRHALQALEATHQDDDLTAINQALAERAAGAKGISVAEAFRIVRERRAAQ